MDISNAIWCDANSVPRLLDNQKPEDAGMQRTSGLRNLFARMHSGADVTVRDYVKVFYSDQTGMVKLFDILDQQEQYPQDDVSAAELVFEELRAELSDDFSHPRYHLHDWTPKQSLEMLYAWKARRAINNVLVILRGSK